MDGAAVDELFSSTHADLQVLAQRLQDADPSSGLHVCRKIWSAARVIRCIVLMSLWAVACSSSPPGAAPSPAPPGQDTAGAKAAPGAHSDRYQPGAPAGSVDKLPDLNGQAEKQLLVKFGPPDKRREFNMAECCTEFQIELFNTYRPERTDRASITIREFTWRYSGYALTVWLHHADGAWQVLNTSRYSDNVEF